MFVAAVTIKYPSALPVLLNSSNGMVACETKTNTISKEGVYGSLRMRTEAVNDNNTVERNGKKCFV